MSTAVKGRASLQSSHEQKFLFNACKRDDCSQHKRSSHGAVAQHTLSRLPVKYVVADTPFELVYVVSVLVGIGGICSLVIATDDMQRQNNVLVQAL